MCGDFLLVHWPYSDWAPDWPWAYVAFNRADAGTSAVVVLVIRDGLFGPREAPENP